MPLTSFISSKDILEKKRKKKKSRTQIFAMGKICTRRILQFWNANCLWFPLAYFKVCVWLTLLTPHTPQHTYNLYPQRTCTPQAIATTYTAPHENAGTSAHPHTYRAPSWTLFGGYNNSYKSTIFDYKSFMGTRYCTALGLVLSWLTTICDECIYNNHMQ